MSEVNEKILVIHPGYPKTGSSSFTNSLKSLNVNILAKPIEDQSKTIWFKLFKEHLYKNGYQKKEKEYNYFKLKNDFKDYLKNFFNNQKRVSVYSDVGMLGRMGNIFGIYNLYIIKEVIEEIENELNIKIIIKFVITIREQHDIISSGYYYGIEDHSKFPSINDFFKQVIQFEEYKNLFDYTLLVKKIIKIFNSEILILPLELLEKDEKKYIDKFCNFLNLEINSNYKLESLNKNYTIEDNEKKYFLRKMRFSKINFLLSSIHNWLKKIEIYKKNFRNNTLLRIIYRNVIRNEKRVLVKHNPNLFKNEIKNLYKKSNMELEKIANINLKELDYY